MDEAIWAVVHRHLRSVFSKDVEAYQETTDEALSLY